MVNEIQGRIGFKVSSRGWCYLMEQAGYIDKSQFDKIENAINNCRRQGILPVDFVAEEDARAFSGVETPTTGEVEDTLNPILPWISFTISAKSPNFFFVSFCVKSIIIIWLKFYS